MTHFEGIALPDGSHDWFVTEEGHREIWACFKSQHYMHEEIAKFEANNPGKKLELVESTINLRFRIIDDAPAGEREDEINEGVVTNISHIRERKQ